MSGSYLCIPRNETVQPPYFQNRIIMFCPQFIHSYIWKISIFPGSVCLLYFAAAKYVDRSWEYINLSQTRECGNWEWGRAIPRKGIQKWDSLQCRVSCMYRPCYLWVYFFAGGAVGRENNIRCERDTLSLLTPQKDTLQNLHIPS